MADSSNVLGRVPLVDPITFKLPLDVLPDSIPTAAVPTGAAGGALTGTYPSPSLNSSGLDVAIAALLSSTSSTTYTTLKEIIQDVVAGLLVAGTNITLQYNDSAGTLTITSA